MTTPTKRVDLAALGQAARKFNLPEAHVRAVVQKESAGIAEHFISIYGEYRPAIRFEGHIFDRTLSDGKRADARSLGLSSPKLKGVKNPNDQAARWRLLERAKNIDPDAALESTSYGVGQIMGFHWKALGFKNVQELVSMACSGQAGQIALMLMFIKNAGLDDELREGRWAAFARGYNGPAYKTNSYDTALEKLAVLYGGEAKAADGMLRMGAKGARVREVQALLIRAGTNLKEDGDFGPSTRDAVKAFQHMRGLTADGVVGPETFAQLNTYRTSAADQPGKQKLLTIPMVQKGVATIVAAGISADQLDTVKGGLEKAATELAATGIQAAFMDTAIHYLTTGASVLGGVGAVVAVYGLVRSKMTVEA